MSHESARPLAAQIDREIDREEQKESGSASGTDKQIEGERALSEAWLV